MYGQITRQLWTKNFPLPGVGGGGNGEECVWDLDVGLAAYYGVCTFINRVVYETLLSDPEWLNNDTPVGDIPLVV